MISIHCLQWQVDRQQLELAQTQAALHKVKEKYYKLDQKLAEIDGRFSIVQMVKEEVKKTSAIKKQLKRPSRSNSRKCLRLKGQNL
jgi:hypothetical protein